MMSFNSHGGSFPFTLKEMELLQQILSEKAADMEQDLKTKDMHVYTEICVLMSKAYAYINLMKNGVEE